MKTSRLHILISILVACALTMTVTSFAYAQKSSLRESPRDEDRDLVPVSKSTINVELWLNKKCGSPYYSGEKALIYFRTDVDGYVTLYDIDTRGNVLVIFPNRHTPDNYIRAGQSYQIPAQKANYDLIVEGPEGIEYIDAVASTDPYYHWNYHQGEPQWLEDWGLKGRKKQEIEVRGRQRETATSYKKSTEYKKVPKEFGATGLQSLARNFEISKLLREQVQSKLVVTPRQTGQTGEKPQQTSGQDVADYNTASCYFYVVEGYPRKTSSTETSPSPRLSQREYLRQQERDFRQIPEFQVQLKEDRLIVEIPNRVLFDFDSYSLRYESREDLNQVARILSRYPDTNILVMGHTDSVGNKSYNQQLSESRAKTVADYLMNRNVESYRINWIGYGESAPVASNNTEAGRQRNRRVELDIKVSEDYGRE